MRPLSGWLYPAAVAVCLLGGLSARAGLVSWTYNWTPTSGVSLNSDTGSGHMSLSNEPLGNATGNSDIVATNLHVFSTAPVGTPDSFNNKTVSLALTLTDTASGKSGTLDFSGVFSGTFSSGHSSVTFVPSGAASGSLTLGNDVYTVAFGAYTPPAPPSAGNAGSIGANVSVNTNSTPPPNGTPEPTSLALASLGLSFLGLVGLGKWRRERALATI